MPYLPYSAKSVSKCLIRSEVCSLVAKLFDQGGRPQGLAVTLAGAAAADYGAFRYLLGYPASKIVFVDTEPDYTYYVYRKYHDVRVITGDIEEVLLDMRKKGEKISFLNLDTCWFLSPRILSVLRAGTDVLSPGGCVAVTFTRAHDQDVASNAGRSTRRLVLHNDVKRFQFLRDNAPRCLKLVYRNTYTSFDTTTTKRHHPMGVACFQKEPKMTNAWWNLVSSSHDQVPYRDCSSKDILNTLGQVHKDLRDRFSSSEVARILPEFTSTSAKKKRLPLEPGVTVST